MIFESSMWAEHTYGRGASHSSKKRKKLIFPAFQSPDSPVVEDGVAGAEQTPDKTANAEGLKLDNYLDQIIDFIDFLKGI